MQWRQSNPAQISSNSGNVICFELDQRCRAVGRRGVTLILGAVIARGLARRLVESKLEGEARRCCWLPLMAACAVSACTLTESAFEPSPVSRVSELSPDESGSMPTARPSLTDPGSATIPDDSSSDEQGFDEIPLEPSQPNPPAPDDDSNGESSATGATPDPGAAPGDADAGAESAEDGTDSTMPETEQPPPEPEPCAGQTFGASCYEVFGEAAAWIAAEQSCVDWGGHLASVESFAENDFIAAWPAQLGIPVGNGSGIWLGGTDVNFGVFQWWDGSALTFQSWAPGQPDNGAGVDCIEKRNDGTGLWYDRRCTDAQPFVCERPL